MTENRQRQPLPESPNRMAIYAQFGGTFLTSALAVVLALAVGALFILVSNQNPFDAYRALLDGAFGGRRQIAETLVASTPMILGGLAFAIAARAGMFNIGIEGQLVMGSLFGGLIGAASFDLPKLIYIPFCLIVGALAGGVWGAIPGFMKARSGASEVITTIMLNYLAFRISTYAVTSAGSWLDWVDPQQKATNKIAPNARLPIILDRTRLHAGFLIALAMALIFWYVLFRTTFGYKIRTVGLSRGAADYAGIAWGATITKAMFLSGALGGLAGVIESTGLLGRHFDTRAGYGFTAIAVGLVGRNHPIGVIFAGLLFGVLRQGSNAMQQNAGTSKELVLILQALVILAISSLAALEYLRARRARIAAARPTGSAQRASGAAAT
jgi:simple sugar transport system permease protein